MEGLLKQQEITSSTVEISVPAAPVITRVSGQDTERAGLVHIAVWIAVAFSDLKKDCRLVFLVQTCRGSKMR